jgi:hypothetical protein
MIDAQSQCWNSHGVTRWLRSLSILALLVPTTTTPSLRGCNEKWMDSFVNLHGLHRENLNLLWRVVFTTVGARGNFVTNNRNAVVGICYTICSSLVPIDNTGIEKTTTIKYSFPSYWVASINGGGCTLYCSSLLRPQSHCSLWNHVRHARVVPCKILRNWRISFNRCSWIEMTGISHLPEMWYLSLEPCINFRRMTFSI